MSDTYNAWTINEQDYPDTATISDKINFWLRFAILAPSAHNTQPWLFSIAGNNLLVHKDRENMLSSGDPTSRQAYIGLGACVENFCLAAGHWGYRASISHQAFLIDDDPVVEIELQLGARTNSPLYRGITKRHTNRATYSSKINFDLDELVKHKALGCARQNFLIGSKIKKTIAKLVGDAMCIGLSMNVMKEELIKFVYSNNRPRSTGMAVETMFAVNHSKLKVGGHKQIIGNINGVEQGIKLSDNFAKSPVICVISTSFEGPKAWIDSGRLMERTLLWAAINGLRHDICAAPIEIPTMWPKLQSAINVNGRPQVVFRLGTPIDNAVIIDSNRRPAKIR